MACPPGPTRSSCGCQIRPELNVQSMNKLMAACDHLPFNRIVVVDSESFDQERLRPGHLYFINTQLLGKDKRLTQPGDKRRFTFWQTVANTVVEIARGLCADY